MEAIDQLGKLFTLRLDVASMNNKEKISIVVKF